MQGHHTWNPQPHHCRSQPHSSGYYNHWSLHHMGLQTTTCICFLCSICHKMPSSVICTVFCWLPNRRHKTAFSSVFSFTSVSVPPTIVERPESQTRPRAGTARFMCQAEGVPLPRISWLKNGKEVHLNGRIKMYNRYCLTGVVFTLDTMGKKPIK